MREECKNFQSRTYKSGEVARFCILGKAPDQPWSCPENCTSYSPRFADVGWSHGTLVDQPVPPPPPGDVEERREVLDSAAEIVNAIAPDMFAERQAELDLEAMRQRRKRGKFWKR
jgi:hypothetical protein